MSIASGGSKTGSNFTDGFSSGTTVANDSGDGVADLLLGLATVSSGYEPETRSIHDYAGLYAQDEYRVTPRLAVTFGLRYDYETGDVEENNLLNYMNLTAVSPLQAQVPSLTLTGGVGIPGLGGTSRQLQNPRKLNFDPRLGVAYNLNDKTVYSCRCRHLPSSCRCLAAIPERGGRYPHQHIRRRAGRWRHPDGRL